MKPTLLLFLLAIGASGQTTAPQVKPPYKSAREYSLATIAEYGAAWRARLRGMGLQPNLDQGAMTYQWCGQSCGSEDANQKVSITPDGRLVLTGITADDALLLVLAMNMEALTERDAQIASMQKRLDAWERGTMHGEGPNIYGEPKPAAPPVRKHRRKLAPKPQEVKKP